MKTFAGTARFISDLHLRPDRADLTQRFERFLADCVASKIDALFILGDLFEYWIGDDDLDDPSIARVVESLRQTTQTGIELLFLHGNRDFLIGAQFARATQARLLPETYVIEARNLPVGAGDTLSNADPVGRTRILLLHGDTLCTDDHEYQNFRRTVRSVAWQEQFLAKSLTVRRAEVETLRQRSKEAVRHKSMDIMDVNSLAVRETLAVSACRIMIHGHTHRPGREVIDAAFGSERWVLSDWDDHRGDFLELRGSTLTRVDWSQ